MFQCLTNQLLHEQRAATNENIGETISSRNEIQDNLIFW